MLETLHAQIDGRVLIFTLLVALATGVLFGLAPAVQATKVDVAPALKETRASSPRGRTRRFGIPFGLSHVLVVSQIAISLVLIAAAGLFVRTLGNLHAVDVGFNRENVLLFNLNAAQAGYKDTALKRFYAGLQGRFRTIPGVRNASMTSMPLVADYGSTIGVTIPGLPLINGKRTSTSTVQVGPLFFETMQIPILLGRPIDERDREGAQATAVVNEVFAQKLVKNLKYPIEMNFHPSKGELQAMNLDDCLEQIAIIGPEEPGNLCDEWQEGFYVDGDGKVVGDGPG